MTAIPLHVGRKAQIWRAGGMIWLISVTFFFALLDLYFAKLQTFQTIGIGTALLIITGVLFAWSIKSLQLSKKLPMENSKNSPIKKWFLIILIIEIVALNIATLVLLKSNHFEYIVPVDILIVSLHFIPLGRIFLMPVYYLLGLVVSSIVVLTLFFVPASSHFGNLISITAIPSLCFILLNWLVIIFILQGSMKYFKE
jgi:hypothetical protein